MGLQYNLLHVLYLKVKDMITRSKENEEKGGGRRRRRVHLVREAWRPWEESAVRVEGSSVTT